MLAATPARGGRCSWGAPSPLGGRTVSSSGAPAAAPLGACGDLCGCACRSLQVRGWLPSRPVGG
eukprot:2646111-Alexandrium_andersonii.AAC.1